ncbi:MAG TPA: hypothetical protein VK956_20735 [Verrucomicrobium sp.]|nr:hypothetical protein [Verrucomicrobium sp.]
MDWRKPWIGVGWLLCALAQGQAHEDPHGEVHPFIMVSSENFIVTSQSCKENSRSGGGPFSRYCWYRVIYSAEGKVVVPRHEIELGSLYPHPIAPSKSSRDLSVHTTPGPGPSRFVLNEKLSSGKTREKNLPLDPQEGAARCASTIAGPWVGFTWTRPVNDPANPNSPFMDLYLSHVARDGPSPGQSVRLGRPTTIDDRPAASSPVWAGGRWWVAWVRPTTDGSVTQDLSQAWKTVLSSYDPARQKLEHKELPALSHWNTTVDLKTTAGWLCASWHASQDGTYPGSAKIVTVFEKVPE